MTPDEKTQLTILATKRQTLDMIRRRIMDALHSEDLTGAMADVLQFIEMEERMIDEFVRDREAHLFDMDKALTEAKEEDRANEPAPNDITTWGERV